MSKQSKTTRKIRQAKRWVTMIRRIIYFLMMAGLIHTTAAKADYDYIEPKQYADLMSHIEEAKEGRNRGYVARLYIPKLNIDVALFRSDITNRRANGQAVCDAEDSAVLDDITFDDTIIIADHNFQGFDAIMQASPGLEGYIITGYEENPADIQKIVCTDAFRGKNQLFGKYGDPFLQKEDGSDAHCPGGYTFYTCMDDSGYGVFVNYWQTVPLG